MAETPDDVEEPVTDAARLPMVEVGLHEDVAGASCAGGVTG